MKNIKKIMMGAFALFLIVFVSACSNQQNYDITPAQVQEKIEAKETFLVVAVQSTCSACKAFEPTVEEFRTKDTKYKTYDVVLDKLDDNDARNEFITKYHISGTPTTLFFKDGQLKTMTEGVVAIDKLEELTNQNLK